MPIVGIKKETEKAVLIMFDRKVFNSALNSEIEEEWIPKS